MKKLLLIAIALLVTAGTAGAAQEMKGIDGERVFIVSGYRFEPGPSGGDEDTGHALCGIRCNALSIDYRNIIDPGGWRFIKVATDKDVRVDLDNPFMDGHCVCTVDEFVVQINDFNWQSRKQQSKEGK